MLNFCAKEFAASGTKDQPEFASFFKLLSDQIYLPELNAEDRKKVKNLRVHSMTVYVVVFTEGVEVAQKYNRHFDMMAADADSVIHSRFCDSRLDYEKLVYPLFKMKPEFELDFDNIKDSLPKFTPVAQNGFLATFGPGAVELEEQLLVQHLPKTK